VTLFKLKTLKEVKKGQRIKPINKIKIYTSVYPVLLKDISESTNISNIEILDKLFRRNFGISEDNLLFKTGLYIIIGDLKIVIRINSIKNRRYRLKRPFDTKYYILPNLGL